MLCESTLVDGHHVAHYRLVLLAPSSYHIMERLVLLHRRGVGQRQHANVREKAHGPGLLDGAGYLALALGT